ncbi:twin-arginine translocase subunit TatC [Salinirarus marinus]|uniref:twin-arginine translocase subunit TatC n=1 Tax=Salinirarus marinus TaxID=3068310 RepID=UPI003C6C67CE
MAEDSDPSTPSGRDDSPADPDDERPSDESTASTADAERDGDSSDGGTSASDGDAESPTDASAPDEGEADDADAPAAERDEESLLAADDAADAESFGAETDADEPAPDPAEDGGTAVDIPTFGDGFEESPDVEPVGWDDGVDSEGPPEDQEMPLAAHIEEMIRRLGVVFLFGGVALLIAYPTAGDIINFLWNTHIPGAEAVTGRRPRIYGPLEFILTKIKVAALAGFIVGLPVFVYETYLFMRPGLYPRERRYYLAAVPTSLVLALVGVAFAHFVVLPAIFAYFTSYTVGTAVVAFGLKETFSLILVLMGYMALVFQIPLFIMLAIMMNLVSRQWMEEKRLLFWGAFLGLAFFISPDPTGMAPIIVGATMISLFEGTLALLRWTGN